MKVRKAVVPAAGLGTRLLPATKAVPKEMLPVATKPAIQHVVEECAESGIEVVILVNGRYKGALEDHFDVSYEVEDTLRRGERDELLDRIEHLSTLVDVVSVRQGRPLGLGHAVSCARSVVGDEPFAVLLPDDLVMAPTPATAQLIEVAQAEGRGCVGLAAVPEGQEHKYGIVAGTETRPGVWSLDTMVEKPVHGTAPSRLAIAGRYVLPGSTFEAIAQTRPGRGGEIQLTDALVTVMQRDGLFGRVLDGQRYDMGDPAGLIEANIAFSLADPELRARLLAFMTRALAEAGSGS